MYKLTASSVTLFYVIFFITNVAYGDNCKRIKNCECTLENDTVIDLTSIANNDGSPRFSFLLVTDSKNETTDQMMEFFFYNPCYKFSLEKEFLSVSDIKNCTDDIGCKFVIKNDGYKLYQEEVISDVKPNFTSSSEITYKDKINTLIVALKCNKTVEQAQASNVTKNGTEYRLTLTTKCACANGCQSPTPTSTPTPKPSGSKLSTGSILLILFFTLLVIYVVGGIIWNGYCLGASGIELLPNLDFWREFPALVTDGARFTVQCCLNRRTTYDSV